MARVQLISCTSVYVLTLPGWSTSVGVKDECILANRCGRPVQGYAPFDKTEDVSGRFILQTFGLEMPKRLQPLRMMRTTLEAKEDNDESEV